MTNEKTRLILNGRIINYITKVTLVFKKDEVIPQAIIERENMDTITAHLLNIDIVPENYTKRDQETVLWSQIICSTESPVETVKNS